MAPKRGQVRDTTSTTTPAAAASTARASSPPASATKTASTPTPTKPQHKQQKKSQAWDKVVVNLASHYIDSTPQRTKLVDSFMAFLVAVGVLQFAYCVLAGNYPFNAFLSGFGATVGQFVLTASLRIQTTEANKSDFPAVSPERAFADYIVCSLILQFFVINFIN